MLLVSVVFYLHLATSVSFLAIDLFVHPYWLYPYGAVLFCLYFFGLSLTRRSFSTVPSSFSFCRWQCLQVSGHGILDKASLFPWSFPARCSMSNSNTLNRSSHLASCPSGSLNENSHLRELWSVRSLNFLTIRKWWKCSVKYTIASSSLRVTQ